MSIEPDFSKSVIPLEKLSGYLLCASHANGRHKLAFFMRHGFNETDPHALANALRRHALENSVCKSETTLFGTRHVVEGPLVAPDGSTPQVRSVWFVEMGDVAPRLLTAYPLRGVAQR